MAHRHPHPLHALDTAVAQSWLQGHTACLNCLSVYVSAMWPVRHCWTLCFCTPAQEGYCRQTDQRKDVRLYYGTLGPDHTAFRDRIPAWEAQGIKVIPVYSETTSGYVQDVYAKVCPMYPM